MLKHETLWLDSIEDDYGVRLSAGQLYYDHRTGRVYAGSEYVCIVPRDKPVVPSNASSWTDSIGHMPRGGRGIETATRNDDPRANCMGCLEGRHPHAIDCPDRDDDWKADADTDAEAAAESRYFSMLPGGDLHGEVRGWNDNDAGRDDEDHPDDFCR